VIVRADDFAAKASIFSASHAVITVPIRRYIQFPVRDEHPIPIVPNELTRADISSLKNVNWHTTPTLLFCDPNVTKQLISLIGCTATRGHLVSSAD